MYATLSFPNLGSYETVEDAFATFHTDLVLPDSLLELVGILYEARGFRRLVYLCGLP